MLQFKTCTLVAGTICLLFFGIPIKRKISVEVKFENFIKQYNKFYENETIYQHRFEAFKNSLRRIDEMNALRSSNSSALYGITKYSDMFEDEFITSHLQRDYSKRRTMSTFSKQTYELRTKRNNIPLKVDWRDAGVVTEVNNQRACGACWAFSVIECIESMYAIKTGNLTKLSTQQVIDCAKYDNDGCNGGDMCALLAWLTDESIAIRTDQQYPLLLKNEKCHILVNATVVDGAVKVLNYACFEIFDEDLLMDFIANIGPISVAINAQSWQYYLGGIIQYHCSSDPSLLNHAVQIVGYNNESEIPYYIVRNSWGTKFGDNGYLYIKIGNNLCGILNEVSFPRV